MKNNNSQNQNPWSNRLLARFLVVAFIFTLLGLPVQAKDRKTQSLESLLNTQGQKNFDLGSIFDTDVDDVMRPIGAIKLPGQSKDKNKFGVEIANFGQINRNYYRGAQPDRQGFRQLKKLGVKTVIDLQEDYKRQEEGWVRDAGMQFYRIPLSSKRAAGDQWTAEFLQLVDDPNNWPVFVHCAGGRHRTGEMTAVYRITKDGWTADQAFEEMKQYEWYGVGGHQPTKDYVYDFYQRYKAGQINLASLNRSRSATERMAQQETTAPSDEEFDWSLGYPVRKRAEARR